MKLGPIDISWEAGPRIRWADTGVPKMDNPPPPPQREAFRGSVAGSYGMTFNGEKNVGDLGPIRQYSLDHNSLRLRSWQLFLESEICQIVFQRHVRWVIGDGLKLQAEPQADVLESEKITADTSDFSKAVEARFRVYSSSRMVDYSNMEGLAAIATKAMKDAIIGGDVLVVLRLVKGTVKVQLIDGAHVGNPNGVSFLGNGETLADNGNRIRHGIEIDATGQHIAYHVRKGGTNLEYERIPARGAKSGALMAFMVYGLKYRLDNIRGIPLISAVMETAKKMDRYKEATLASAEERAKIPYTVEHDLLSTGENPFNSPTLKALQATMGNAGTDAGAEAFAEAALVAQTIAATSNKNVYNMPGGSKLKALESDAENNFAEFFTTNIDLVCATVGIPPNVAMMKYNDSFSASRAGLKDWEHSMQVTRKDFAFQFYQNVYNFWLSVEILSNKIVAPGYLESVAKGNAMALEAYQYARWAGTPVPHIDPVKEVTAQRLMLGEDSANIPLTTFEAAAENLNNGDFQSNLTQYADEKKASGKLGIKDVDSTPPARQSTGGADSKGD